MEELAHVEDGAVADASAALALALRRWGDPDAYARALAAFHRVPLAARWIVELIVEAELAANDVALRYPSGIRGGAS
jgi:hypothetical protein